MKIVYVLLACASLAGCVDQQRWQYEEYQPFFGDMNGPRPDWAHAERENAKATMASLEKMGVPVVEADENMTSPMMEEEPAAAPLTPPMRPERVGK